MNSQQEDLSLGAVAALKRLHQTRLELKGPAMLTTDAAWQLELQMNELIQELVTDYAMTYEGIDNAIKIILQGED